MHQSVACHAVHRVLAAPVVQEDYIKDEMKNLKREMIRAKEVRGRVACAWSAVVYDRACWWFFQTAHGVDARVVLRARSLRQHAALWTVSSTFTHAVARRKAAPWRGRTSGVVSPDAAR